MDYRLNCKARNYKALRGKHRQYTLGHTLQQDPLWLTFKSMEIKTNMNKWDLMKLKSFCTRKETINNINRQPSESGKKKKQLQMKQLTKD